MVTIYNATGIKGTAQAIADGSGKTAEGSAFGQLVKGTVQDLKGAGELLSQTHGDLAASRISEQELVQNLTQAQLSIERTMAIARLTLEAIKKTVETPL